MRIKSVVIVIIGCLGLAGTDVLSEPLANVARERRSYYMSSPPYGWYPTYDIEFLDQDLHIYTSIYLYGTGGATQQQIGGLKPIWEEGIEGNWSNRYNILHDDWYYYDIVYDVSFVDSYQSGVDHYQVRVRPGPERSNMLTWDTEDTPQVAAHEYGHMVGNYDEYSGGATNPSNPIIDRTSIMGSTSPAAVSYARHYEPVMDWLEGKYPSDLLEVVPSPEAVVIDIKPGSDPNSVNPGSGGLLPVVILGNEEFNVYDIDLSSLELARAAPRTKGKSGKIGSFKDINNDNLADLMVHFRMSDLDIAPDTVELFLRGSLNDGLVFRSSDSIRIVPSGDINGDGFVGGADLSIVINNWGLSNSRYEQGDLTGDGFVGAGDYQRVLTNWGQTGSSEAAGAIPEPTTLGLVLLGGLLLSRRGWRE